MSSESATTWKFFEGTAVDYPSKIAVEDENNCTWTYAQLLETTESFATLCKLRENRNPFVVSLVSGGIKHIVSSLTTLALSKIVVVPHDNYTGAQVEKCLKTLNFPTVITTHKKWDLLRTTFGHTYPHLHFIPDIIEPGFTKNEVEQSLHKRLAKKRRLCSGEKLDDVAYCLFTSGSTGNPKAVLVRHRTVVNATDMLIATDPLTFTSSVRSLMGVSVSFIVSLADIWPAFQMGGTVVIPPADIKLDIDRYRTWITQRSITAAAFSTNVMELLMAKDVHKMTSLQFVFFGGARLNPQKIRLQDAHFMAINSYGSTESCHIAMCLISKETAVTTSVGKPVKGAKVYIVDENGQQVTEPEVRGEIYVAGEGLMRGYQGQPVLTSKVLTPNPFEPNLSPIYKTGDYGYWSSDGELFVTGREDDQVKVHGIRLELGEIQSVLSTYPGIRQAVVLAHDPSENGATKQIFGFCTLEPEQTEPDRTVLEQFLIELLQRHAIPRFVFFLDKMPLTASGKIDRVGLKQSLAERCRSVGTELTTSKNPDIEEDKLLEKKMQMIRSIWADELKLLPQQISFTDNFFYLGGNSVMVFSVMAKLQQIDPKLDRVSPFILFKVPVLKDFVQTIISGDFSTDVKISAIDFNTEIELPNDFLFHVTKPAILITGTTGFLGSLLLVDALKAYKGAEIFTIIRANDNDAARKRLLEVLASFEPHCNFIDFEHVHCLAGDLTKPKFGLDEVTYDKMTQKVKVIFHSAAEVSLMKTYEQLRQTTVVMTKNILSFAVEGATKELHYMSTIGVFDGVEDVSCLVYEASEDQIPPEVNPSKMMNGYFQSKWVSEQLVWNAAEHGLGAVLIYRIGQIGAHTVTKVVNRSDAIAGFLITCKKLQQYPCVPLRLPFVDGDLSETIIALSKTSSVQSQSRARVFHLVGRDITLDDFLEGDPGMRRISLPEWEVEFQKNVANAPKTEDEINAWLFLQILKEIDKPETEKRKIIMKNISFSVTETEKTVGNKFRKINSLLYLDLLSNMSQNEAEN